MKYIIVNLSLLVAVNFATAQVIGATDKIELKTIKDSASYALGYNIGQSVAQRFGTLDKQLIVQAMLDAANNKPSLLDVNLTQQIITTCMTKESEAASAENVKAGAAFLAENKKVSGVIETKTGLQYKVLTMGNGPKPTTNDMVKVNYEGRLLDGTVFDASNRHGGTAQFGVTGVITGWTEALLQMPVGSKYQLYLPSNLAYGNTGSGQMIKPGATLIFDVELLEIVKQQPPAAPQVMPAKPTTTIKPSVKPKPTTPIKRKN
jgi:FKBP-type peptidyl-prolyl cis-trans isomerase FklB